MKIKNMILVSIIIITVLITLILSCANLSKTGSNSYQIKQNMIIDHNAVNDFNNIPNKWITEVKKMYLNVPGISHSRAYRDGLYELSLIDSKYSVLRVRSGSPSEPTVDALRIDNAFWRDDLWQHSTGEEQFWSTETAVNLTKSHIDKCVEIGSPITAMGFGWCWDMTAYINENDVPDSKYNCRWGGFIRRLNNSTIGQWGIDSNDSEVNLQTYLNAIEDLKSYDTNTVVFFTTGPVDDDEAPARIHNTGESGYQRWIKHEFIREHVIENGGILFDYADILCYDNNGDQNTVSWTAGDGTVYTYPFIADDNFQDNGTGHIGYNGRIRIAKALWYMMARIAGWNGES